jgi:FAD/FMN-containing dehydrogenase
MTRRSSGSPNAISYRDAAFGMNVVMFALPGREEQVDRIQLALIDGLRPWATSATLPNYLGSGNTRPSQVRAAYRDTNYERLAAVKATHDPRNLFRINHNIPPRPNRRHGPS